MHTGKAGRAPRLDRFLRLTASQDAEGKPGKGPCLLGPLKTEPQNQKGAEQGAEDKASQEVSCSHHLATEDSRGCTQHCPPPDACLLPCQGTKDHQASSRATVLVAAIMDPIVGWEEPHKEGEEVCAHKKL